MDEFYSLDWEQFCKMINKIIIFVVLLMVMCKKNKENNLSSKSFPYEYLRVGYKQTFDVLKNGVLIDSLTSEIKNRNANGEFTNELKDAFATVSNYLYVQNDSLKQFKEPQSKSEAGLFYHNSLPVNYMYFKKLGLVNFEVQIIAKNVTVNSRVGKYECTKWIEKNLNNSQKQTVYFNSKIGVMLIEITLNGTKYEYKLREIKG